HLPVSGLQPQAGAVNSAQRATPGAGVNTLQPSLSASGEFAGSLPGAAFNGRLSLADAIRRGLAYNLGAAQWSDTARQAAGAALTARSALLPNLSGSFTENVQQTDLKAMGFRFTPALSGIGAGLSFPTIVGPFNYMQLQASLAQSLLDFTARDNYHASQATLRADLLQLRDARSLVVLGVGGAYLGVIAAQARLVSAQAQLTTANAILEQARQKQQVGSVARLTVDQNQVQAAIQQLQLSSLQNDLDKQKINLARMIGLAPTANFQLTDAIPFAPPPPLSLAAALSRALQNRADLQAAAAQAEAARAALAAARAERLPSASVAADYGLIGTTLTDTSHGIFAVAGTVHIPLWQGGRVTGDLQQAQAVLAHRQAEQADLRGQIKAQVQVAFLDLATAADQVKVAQNNLTIANEALSMARDRFQAGVSNTVELIQAQQQAAVAEQDVINSTYAHNLAKLTLARTLGDAPASWPQFLPVRH
ncbi:MAG: TolC family protein, partial [Terriglobales bacterium]